MRTMAKADETRANKDNVTMCVEKNTKRWQIWMPSVSLAGLFLFRWQVRAREELFLYVQYLEMGKRLGKARFCKMRAAPRPKEASFEPRLHCEIRASELFAFFSSSPRLEPRAFAADLPPVFKRKQGFATKGEEHVPLVREGGQLARLGPSRSGLEKALLFASFEPRLVRRDRVFCW